MEQLKNPYDAEYYRTRLGPLQTDGFIEWSLRPGLTVLDLTFGELMAAAFAILGMFIISVVSALAGIMLAVAVFSALFALTRLRKRYGPNFFSIFVWKAGLPPPNGFFPYQSVPRGELRKVWMEYRRP